MAAHPTYVPPGRRLRNARLAQQNRDAIEAEKEMKLWQYPPPFIREELERIRSESYNPSSSE